MGGEAGRRDQNVLPTRFIQFLDRQWNIYTPLNAEQGLVYEGDIYYGLLLHIYRRTCIENALADVLWSKFVCVN